VLAHGFNIAQAADIGGGAQVSAAPAFKIRSLEDLERVTASVGQVGPRTGPGKRSTEQMEWYVLRQFLEKAIPATIFKLPIAGRNGCPPDEPDFVLMRPGTADVIALVEITKATDKADQREMKEFERSGKRMALLGHSGGRLPPRPELAWASDIIDAIKRKEPKVIFKSSLTPRHLIIYPTSNASLLLGDQPGQEGKNEWKAIGHLREAIDSERNNLAKVANGCLVHVLGNRHICVDILGDMEVLHR
jgi:hypothetical protein